MRSTPRRWHCRSNRRRSRAVAAGDLHRRPQRPSNDRQLRSVESCQVEGETTRDNSDVVYFRRVGPMIAILKSDLVPKSDLVRETRMSRKLMDVFIRAGLVLALTLLCYRIFAPFITMMAWALILAVTIYPGHQALARKLGGRQGLAATLLVVGGIALIVVPTAVVLGSMGDSV